MSTRENELSYSGLRMNFSLPVPSIISAFQFFSVSAFRPGSCLQMNFPLPAPSIISVFQFFSVSAFGAGALLS
jgi:hypothetical protein